MPETPLYTEYELVLLLKQRTGAAFNYLYDNYSGALYNVVFSVLQDKELANDVLQEIFIKIWRQIEQYDSSKGRLFTWMVNISRNASIDTLRSKSYNKQKQNRELTENVYQAAGATNIETDRIGLRKIVGTLKDDHKVLVELAYFQGYTQDEISKMLDIPLGTVKTRLRSALVQLKDFFEKVMDIREYIQSGAIEQYVLGLASNEEAAELQQLRMQNPEINDAVISFENDLENYLMADKIQPSASVKTLLEKELFGSASLQDSKEVLSKQQPAPVYNMRLWRFVAAASIILLAASTALNFYFYSGFKNSQTQYEALLNEKNTLQANNASYKSALDSVDATMQSLHLDAKKYKQQIAGLQESFSIMHNPDVKEIKLNGILNKSNLATVYYNQRTKQVYFFENYMPATPTGKQYQLWAIVGGKPVDAGVIDVCSGLCRMKIISNAQAFAVTLEKEGGSALPTLTAMYVMGKV